MEQVPSSVEKTLSEYLFRQLNKLESAINIIRGNTSKGMDRFLIPYRNAIVNSSFYIAQRGTSQTGNGVLSVDMWRLTGVGTTKSMQRVLNTYADSALIGTPSYIETSTTGGSLAGDNTQLKQKMPFVQTFSRQKCTLSFMAKADAAKPMSIEVFQDFGTGGSADVSCVVKKINLTTSWKTFEIPFDMPSIAGKIIGTGRTDCIHLVFWLSAGSDFNSSTDSLGLQDGTFDISKVQLTPGFSYEYVYPGIEEDYSNCLAHYEKSFSYNVAPVQNAGTVSGSANGVVMQNGSAINRTLNVSFKAQMRTDTPTITLYNPQALNSQARDTTANLDCTNTALSGVNDKGFYVNTTAPTGGSIGDRLALHWTADATL